MLMDAEEGGTIQLAGEGHQETDLQTDIAADKRRRSFRGISCFTEDAIPRTWRLSLRPSIHVLG